MNLNPKAQRDIFVILFVMLIVILSGREHVHSLPVLKPISDVYAAGPVSTPTQAPEPTTENIVAYIAKVFAPEGTAVVVKAIDCFYSESKLKTDAYNYNAWNKTEDRGVAQINSIHGMKPEDAHDFQKSIDMAYQIYINRGKNFSAWYGKGCR